jgi:hypothetical protein
MHCFTSSQCVIGGIWSDGDIIPSEQSRGIVIRSLKFLVFELFSLRDFPRGAPPNLSVPPRGS